MRNIFLVCWLVLWGLNLPSLADEGPYEDLKKSTSQMDKDWDKARKEFSEKFKKQLSAVSKAIQELKNTVDNGDQAKRKEINKELKELKQTRDDIREALHQITATSVTKFSAIQKHFINAKKDD